MPTEVSVDSAELERLRNIEAMSRSIAIPDANGAVKESVDLTTETGRAALQKRLADDAKVRAAFAKRAESAEAAYQRGLAEGRKGNAQSPAPAQPAQDATFDAVMAQIEQEPELRQLQADDPQTFSALTKALKGMAATFGGRKQSLKAALLEMGSDDLKEVLTRAGVVDESRVAGILQEHQQMERAFGDPVAKEFATRLGRGDFARGSAKLRDEYANAVESGDTSTFAEFVKGYAAQFGPVGGPPPAPAAPVDTSRPAVTVPPVTTPPPAPGGGSQPPGGNAQGTEFDGTAAELTAKLEREGQIKGGTGPVRGRTLSQYLSKAPGK